MMDFIAVRDGTLERDLKVAIRDVPDFPKAGIVFKDITPLLGDAALLGRTVDALVAPFRDAGVTHVVAIESRGFIFGAPAALALGAGFVPIRKPGKLPSRTAGADYALEYGTDRLEIHADAFGHAPARVLVVDDLLATGGTAGAAVTLAEQLGATIAGCAFVVELAFLGGLRALPDRRVVSLVRY